MRLFSEQVWYSRTRYKIPAIYHVVYHASLTIKSSAYYMSFVNFRFIDFEIIRCTASEWVDITKPSYNKIRN